ncbi:uncharacterized protein LOC144152261 isoform X3 [Haemaphysalis longicornis]
MGIETARMAIHDMCQAIWARLKDKYVKVPTTEDWAASADGYSRRWQFPNCLGAVNGKHVAIAAPPKSGSLFYNYKMCLLPLLHSAMLGPGLPPSSTLLQLLCTSMPTASTSASSGAPSTTST